MDELYSVAFGVRRLAASFLSAGLWFPTSLDRGTDVREVGVKFREVGFLGSKRP
jgi:hypothetical protein